MANHFTKASFTFAVTDAEAEIFRHVGEAAEIVGNSRLAPDQRAAAYADLGAGFAACFPPIDSDPFGGFLAILSDPDYPRLGFSVQVDPSDGTGRCKVWLHGDQFDVETAAQLIQKVAKSALPAGFEYCLDCDRLRPGEFGGGYVVIREDRFEFASSAQLLERALSREHREGADGYVLTTRDAEEGLLFWNNDTGFGELSTATVFSEAEAGRFDVPIAHDQPEWLAMPAPIS